MTSNIINIKQSAPYNDKWRVDSEYYHVLFRSGDNVTLQAGELNEIQSILQSQLKHAGDHLFKNGSIVIPGAIQVIENKKTISIEILTANSTDVKTGHKVRMSDGSISSIVITNPIDNQNVDCIIDDIYDLAEYDSDDMITIIDESNNPIATGYITNSSKTTYTVISNGIIYVNGYFVTLHGDTIVPSWHNTSTEGYEIGVELEHSVVTEHDDVNLYSNVQGYPDVRSSGAHRIQINANLKIYTKSDFESIKFESPYDFIVLVSISEENTKEFIKESVDYNELETYLAQRTYEESGHYIINHPKYSVLENLKTSTQLGRFSKSEGGRSDVLSFGIKPWLGYIYGHRTNVQSTSWLDIEKPKEVFKYNNTTIPKTYSNILTIELVQGLPFIGAISFLDADGNVVAHSSIIDASKKNNDVVNKYNAVLDSPVTSIYDISITNLIKKSDNEIVSVVSSDGRFLGTVLSDIPNITQSDTLVKIPFKSVEDVSDVTITAFEEFSSNTDSDGKLTLTTTTINDIFNSQFENKIYLAYVEGTNLIEVQDTFVCEYSSTPNGRTIELDLGSLYSNKNIVGMFPIRKAVTKHKSVSSVITSERVEFDSAVVKDIKLSKAFIKDVISIVVVDHDSLIGMDVTDHFDLISTETVTATLPASLTYNGDEDIAYGLEVTYKYSSHNSGDFVVSKSYPENFTNELTKNDGTVVHLDDYIDFRVIMDYDGKVVADCLYPIEGSLISLDVNVIKDKAVSICVNSDNSIFSLDGTSSLFDVTYPKIPEDSVELFKIRIPGDYKSIDEITVESIKYPNYTMNDIHKLDKRIKNLEYYTSLSMLETQASTYEVIDSVLGLPRFKNGFAVSNFTDFGILNNDREKFQAGISVVRGGLHPMTTSHPKTFNEINMTRGLTKRADVVMLDYKDVEMISQKIATSDISVNPYSVFAWKGDMTVFPQTDFWHDTIYNDASVVILNDTRAVVNAPDGNVIDRTVATVETQTTTTTEDELVNIQVSETMRPITIRLEVEAVKPVTKFDLFFDGQLVNDLVTQSGMNTGAVITSDLSGKCDLTLSIPASNTSRSFPTGLSKISLVVKGGNIETPAASALFEAGGDLEIRQLQLSVQNDNVVTVDVEGTPQPTIINNFITNNTFNTIVEEEPAPVIWTDPVAESFYVEGTSVFISKIGVYFSSKHSNVPVMAELRPMVNGVIANGTLPDAVKILYPSQVKTSTDCSEETIFEFDRPIFLQGNNEYALVIKSDSDDYRIYKATLGETPINSVGAALSNQTFMGVFFKSQNGSTWTEDQNTDMTFNLYRADFNSTAETYCDFYFKNTEKVSRDFHIINGSKDIIIECPGHYLSVGDNITILSDTNGLLNSTLAVSEIVDGNTFKVHNTKLNDANVLLTDVIFEIKLTYDSARLMLDTFNISTATISTELHTTGLVNNDNIIINDNMLDIQSKNKLVASDNNKNFIRAYFNTSNSRLSPMIRVGSSGVVCFNKLINNDIENPLMFAETIAFQFENPFENATLLFSAKLPGSSEMKIDYKLLEDEYDNPNNVEWKETSFKSISDETKSKQSVNTSNGYFEYEISIEEEEINTIMFRFRFASDDGTNEVEMKDFRMIAFS